MPIFSEDPGAHIKLSAETLQSLSWQSQSLGSRQHPFRRVPAHSKPPAKLGSLRLFTDPWGDSCAYKDIMYRCSQSSKGVHQGPRTSLRDCSVRGEGGGDHSAGGLGMLS